MIESRDSPFRYLTVLVVDENKNTLALITQMLRGFGVGQVEKACDAPSALAVLRSKQIDLIICDWQMTPVDGVKFTQLVRRAPASENPFVPIIMLTAHGAPDLVFKARDAGITEFLVKPISPATLLARIVSVVKSPRDFIETPDFFGPDRRRKSIPHSGSERRVDPPKIADRSNEGRASSGTSSTPGDRMPESDAAEDSSPHARGSETPHDKA